MVGYKGIPAWLAVAGVTFDWLWLNTKLVSGGGYTGSMYTSKFHISGAVNKD